MPKKFLFIVFVFYSLFTFSQKSSLNGVLTDGEKTPNHSTVVALLTPKDSILYRFTRSDKEGKYELKNLKTGSYIFMSSHSQYADYIEDIIIKENQNNVGEIQLISKSKLLREVIIKSGSIRIKGDKTSYRASDFRVDANANVEELLTTAMTKKKKRSEKIIFCGTLFCS